MWIIKFMIQYNCYLYEKIYINNNYLKSKPFGKSNDVILNCNIDNYHAIHIYEKIGFNYF